MSIMSNKFPVKRLVSVFLAGSLLMCTAFSCGSSGSDDDPGAKKSSISEEKSDSPIVGTWDMAPECYEGMEANGMKALSMHSVFNDDETLKEIAVLDSSNFLSLYDDKIVVGGHKYNITAFTRNKLIITDSTGDIIFVRTSESSDKYGEYYFPEELSEQLEVDSDSTIIFESPGVSKMNLIMTGTYSYDESTNKIKTRVDGDQKTNKLEFDGNDKFSYTTSEGRFISFTRAD